MNLMGRAAGLMSVIERSDAKVKLLLVLIVAAGLRLVFFAPYVKTDDIAYIQSAYFLATQQTIAPSHWGTRLGLIGPTAVLYALFGVSGVTTGAYPLLCSLLQIPVVYVVGRRLFGEPSGLLAAALLAFFPLDVIFASHLFPCSPIGLWAGLSCMFAVCQASKHAWLNLLAAGLCIGVACTVRATAVFCLPLLLISTFWPGAGGRRPGVTVMFRSLCVLAGLATIIAVEAGVFYWLTDEWFYRWRVLTQQVVHQGGEVVGAVTTLGWYLRPMTRLLTEQEMALFPFLLAPAVVYHVWRRPGRHSRFLAAWVLFIFVYTFYGTVSPLRFAPLPRLPRYLSLATLPAMVLLASFLCTAFGRRWRAMLMALLLASGVLGVWLDNGRAVAADTRELHSYMNDRPGERFILTTPVLFDVLLYHGFEPPQPLAVFAEPADNAAAPTADPLASYRRLHPPLIAIDSRKHVPAAAHLVVADASLQQRIELLGGAELVASFAPPDRLYHRILRHRLMLKLLSLTRDEYRMGALAWHGQSPKHPTIWIYRIAGK